MSTVNEWQGGTEWRDDMPVPSTDQARRTDGGWTRDPDVADRDHKAMRLRASGWTYHAIAQELGYASRGHARTQIERAYLADARPNVEAYREAMDDQLDQLVERITKVMDTRHLKVNAGQVVFDPTSGGLLEDDAPILAAADRILKVLERRAKLHGLDAPTKVQAQVASVRVTVDGAEDV